MHRRTQPPTATPRTLLTPAALHILLALAGEARHGHAIKQNIEARTEGAMRLGPATLYEALHRMMRAGWIVNSRSEPSPSGAARKYYRLTTSGRRVMTDELRRLELIVRDARTRALLPQPGKR